MTLRAEKSAITVPLLVAFAFLFLHVFMLPWTPVAAWGDQSLFLLEARHMLEGKITYRDLFEFNTPGTAVVYWALFKLFGVRAWIPDLMLVLLGSGLVWLSLTISRKLMRGASVLLPGLLFLTFSYRSMLDGTHHWYSTLAVIAALAVVIDTRSARRLALAGALCGIASFFTSTRGPAAVLGLATFVLWERFESWRSTLRRQGALLSGFLATVVVTNAYFVWKAGLSRFLYCTVIFPVKYYPAEPYNNWRVYLHYLPHIHPWSRPLEYGVFLFIHILLPLVYLLFFVRYWHEARSSTDEPWDRLMLVNLTGVSLFLGIIPSPGFYRLCSVSLPALILLAWFLQWPGRVELWARRVLWSTALFLAIAEPVMRQNHWRACFNLPTGRTAYLDATSYEQFEWVYERARPSDFLFGDSLIAFALGLGDPAQMPYVTTSDYTRPEQIHDLVEALEKYQVRFVFWYSALNVRDPAHAAADHLDPLRAYLHTHYHLTAVFGSSNQVLERNE